MHDIMNKKNSFSSLFRPNFINPFFLMVFLVGFLLIAVSWEYFPIKLYLFATWLGGETRFSESQFWHRADM